MTELPSYPEDAAEREAAQPTITEERQYSGWWRRVAAFLIDTLIIAVPLGVIIGVFAALDVWAVVVVAYIAIIVLPFVYFTYFHGSPSGATPGKRALGIRVVSEDTGTSISHGRAFGRYAITVVFSILFIPWVLDYLWPLWDPKHQAWHDKVVSSIVVRA